MTPSTQPQANYSKRFWLLGLGIIAAIVAYSIAWFVLAGRMEAAIDKNLAQWGAGGTKLECTAREAGGYPFRLGLFCDGLSYEDIALTIKTGAVRSAAQIYAPRKIFAEMDGPAIITAANGDALTIQWQSLAASFVQDQPLPQRASIEGKSLTFEPTNNASVMVEGAQAHMRQRDGAADLALALNAISAPALANAPAGNLIGDLTLQDAQALIALESQGLSALRGQALTLHHMAFNFQDSGSITLTGPLAFDAAGLATGEITITIKDLAGFMNATALYLPAFEPALRQNQQLLAPILGIADDKPITLSIKQGRVIFGFFTLFNIPPIEAGV